MSDYINESKIFSILEASANLDKTEVREIIAKSRECRGLTLEETGKLLFLEDKDLLEELYQAAKYIKNKIYGKRVVLFAPLYTGNECVNNCLYCGFRRDNKELHRRTLELSEIVNEAKALEKQGQKTTFDMRRTSQDRCKHFTKAMDEIYKSTDIRRINIEAALMTVEDYKELKQAE